MLHDAEHAVYLVVGYLFFLPIVGSEPIRWRLSYPIRFLLLAVAMPVDTFTGLILSMQGSPLHATDGPAPPGSPNPLQDVHWAGAIMWVAGDALMFAFMMLVFLMWARADRGGASSLGWLERVRSNSFDTWSPRTGRRQPHTASPAGRQPRPAGRRQPRPQPAIHRQRARHDRRRRAPGRLQRLSGPAEPVRSRPGRPPVTSRPAQNSPARG